MKPCFSLLLLLPIMVAASAFAQTATDINLGSRLTSSETIPGSFILSWWGRPGMNYLIETNPDLESPWSAVPAYNPTGGGAILRLALNPSETQDRFFFRITEFDPGSLPANIDSDGDGRTDAQELADGTDPNDFYNGKAPVLEIVSGGSQHATPGSWLPDAIVIRATSSDGAPLRYAPLVFEIASGGGGVSITNTVSTPLTVISLRTDGDGLATIYWKIE